MDRPLCPPSPHRTPTPCRGKAGEHYFKTRREADCLSTPLIVSGCEKNKEPRRREERQRRWRSREQMMPLQAPGSTDSLLRNSLPFLFISPLKFFFPPPLLSLSSLQWMTTEQQQIRQTSGGLSLAGCPDRLCRAPEQSMSAHNGASASG